MQKLILLFSFLSFHCFLMPDDIQYSSIHNDGLVQCLHQARTEESIPHRTMDELEFRNWVTQTRSEGNNVDANTAESAMRNIEMFNQRRQQEAVTPQDIRRFLQETMVLVSRLEQ
jgi:hypothetical protein